VGLSWEILYSATTDGAPALTGRLKGFVALLRKKLERTEESLKAIHCLIHQEALCASIVKLGSVMSVVVKTVNYLRSHGLTHRQFQQFLEEFGEEYTDIPYHCEVRWLSKAKVLKRFFELRPAIVEFLKKKGKPEPMFEDPTWVADLAFLVDLTSHLNVLNISMQGEGHLITDLAEKISDFQRKLSLWKT